MSTLIKGNLGLNYDTEVSLQNFGGYNDALSINNGEISTAFAWGSINHFSLTYQGGYDRFEVNLTNPGGFNQTVYFTDDDFGAIQFSYDGPRNVQVKNFTFDGIGHNVNPSFDNFYFYKNGDFEVAFDVIVNGNSRPDKSFKIQMVDTVVPEPSGGLVVVWILAALGIAWAIFGRKKS